MVEHRFVEPITVVRFHYAVPLPARLTVGLQTLTLAIVVRIHGGQPIGAVAKRLMHGTANP